MDDSIEWMGGNAHPTLPQRIFFSELSKSFRNKSNSTVERLFGLINVFLKDAKTGRGAFLDWIGRVCDGNVHRTRSGHQMGFQESPVSSDGFLTTLSMVMLRLCDPFIDLEEQKARVSRRGCL